MGFLSRKLGQRDHPSNPKEWLLSWFGGGKTASGATVDNYTALNYTALWACVRVISKAVSTMPLHLYERLDTGGKQRAVKHPLYLLLHSRPNPEMVPLTFKDTLTAHVLTWGNGYAEIERNKSGYPIALWPLTPNRVAPERDKKSREIQYRITLPDGGAATLSADQVFHIPGPGFDGTKGYSVLTMFRESVGLGMALQEYSARFFGNGAAPMGILEHPESLKDPAKNYLRDSWNEMHQGLSNVHRVAILEEGMKYHQIGISPEDAQMLESRKFSQLEMASMFQIPPHKVQNLDKASFDNIEHQSQEFLTDTLLYWLTLWEQTIGWKLLSQADQLLYFAEFLTANLLRGDLKSRYEAYAIAKQWGWYNSDDIRDKENDNPLPDDQGKDYWMPLNMRPVNMAGHSEPQKSEGGENNEA